MLTVRRLGIVLGGLASLGYDAAWKVLSAGDCGAPHERARMWIVAKDTDADGAWELQPQRIVEEQRRRYCNLCKEVSNSVSNGLQGRRKDGNIPRQIGLRGGERPDEIKCLSESDWGREWWASEPGLGRVADGVANRVDRIKADGNGQVSIVVVRAFCDLMEVLENA